MMENNDETRGNIVTLCLNPALDTAFRVKQLLSTVKCQSDGSRYDPGGNAINVSRALKLLGVDAFSCCVLAGESGEMLRNLLLQQVDHLEAFEVEGSTRINCVIHQIRPPEEFKVGGVGAYVSSEDLSRISERFLELSRNGIGILTGSLPPGVDESIYTHLGEQLHDNNAKVVIDAHSNILLGALPVKPYLIKPNHHELELLAGKTLTSFSAIAERTRELQKQGVENICVSLGSEGAIFTNNENSYFCEAPKIRPACSIGAGDSMLAGVLVALTENRSAEDILRLGIACGTSTTAQPGTVLFNPDNLQSVMDEIEITRLDI